MSLLIHTLAKNFSRDLFLCLGRKTFSELAERNSGLTAPNTSTCLSHEYCDSNEVMLNAFESLFKKKLNLIDAQAMTLVNDAWRLAKISNFFIKDFILGYKKPEELRPWTFVERFYPGYGGAGEIAHNDDLAVLIDKEDEEDSCARELLIREYDGDNNHPQLKIDFLESTIDIYERAILAYLEMNQKGTTTY